MLHALNARKARLRNLISGEGRIPFEDIVTSTVFGPLTLLRSDERAAVIGAIAQQCDIPAAGDDFCSLHLWSRRDGNRFRPRSVEPDVVVDFGNGAQILIEVKWGAALDRNELAAQWASLSPVERQQSYHLLLVREPSRYAEAIREDEEELRKWLGETDWRHRLRVCSWRAMADIVRRLEVRPDIDAGVRTWAKMVAVLLSREELRVQVGWGHLGLVELVADNWEFNGLGNGNDDN